MTLIEQINVDFMAAYKAKDMETKDFLGVLKTEVTKESKTPEDSVVISKIKSMIKNAASTDSLSDTELAILETYLPKQMTLEELSDKIRFYINLESLEGRQGMGSVMTFLKENYAGRYDGKAASSIAREMLGC